MSEETRFFYKEQSGLLKRGDVCRTLTIFGGISLLMAFISSAFARKKIDTYIGVGAAVTGVIGIVVSSIEGSRLKQAWEDLNAVKYGLLPRKKLGKVHIHLSSREQIAMKSANEVERVLINDAVAKFDGTENAHTYLEAAHEEALIAARSEWSDRIRTSTDRKSSRA